MAFGIEYYDRDGGITTISSGSSLPTNPKEGEIFFWTPTQKTMVFDGHGWRNMQLQPKRPEPPILLPPVDDFDDLGLF